MDKDKEPALKPVRCINCGNAVRMPSSESNSWDIYCVSCFLDKKLSSNQNHE